MLSERIRVNRFLVVGRAGMDLYADPPGTRTELAQRFTAALGGSAANIAAGIARLGGAASLVTAVSDDAVGRFVRNELASYGVGAEYVCNTGGEARNSLAVVETRAEDCQSVIYRNGAADFQLTTDQIKSIDFAPFGAVIVTGTALAVEPSRAATFLAMAMAREHGLPVILDVDYRPYSWTSVLDAATTCTQAASISDVVIGNDEEFAVMAGAGGDGVALARQLAVSTAAIVVYKMGARGAVTFADGEVLETGVYPVKALKPTGAGDAFLAAFVAGLAEARPVYDCVWRGSAAAALVVTRVGCAPAMPTLDELNFFRANQWQPR